MASPHVAEPRVSCALGAQQTVVAIERATPIVHAGPGCSAMVHGFLTDGNGAQGSGARGGAMIVGTNTGEREVVFGGEAKLRSVIDAAPKVMDSDLFVVLTGCTSELVGDDVENVVAEYRRDGLPIVFASTGGFRGSNLVGHETVVNAIIDQLIEPATEVDPLQVNLFAGAPFQNPFWRGELATLRALLSALGLRPNILFGPGTGGLAAWRRIPAAGLNLVVSAWTDVATARLLEKRFGTPWLHVAETPVGALGTADFLRRVATAAGVDPARVERVIAEAEVEYDHQFERVAEWLAEARCDLPDRFATVGDATLARGLSRFLVDELGFLPARHIVIDQPPTAFRPGIIDGFAPFARGRTVPVDFLDDGSEIRAALESSIDEHGPLLVLGGAWDRGVVRERGGIHLSISTPASDRLILSRHYAGFRGGWTLLEDAVQSRLATLM